MRKCKMAALLLGFSLTVGAWAALPALASSGAEGSGEVLVDVNFDDGDVDGFTTYIEGGDCDISNVDGQLAVDIRSCGAKDYANQVYWDGLSLTQGLHLCLQLRYFPRRRAHTGVAYPAQRWRLSRLCVGCDRSRAGSGTYFPGVYYD